MFEKKKITLGIIGVFFCLINSLQVSAQNKEGNVGIGTVTPDRSAILDLSSNDRGLLLPRMTLQQRSLIKNPAEGLVVYQVDFLNGLYVYSTNGWSQISHSGANLVANATSWNTNGNSADSTSFLGTINDVPLIFKVNNKFAGLLDNKRNNTFLGYKTGWATQSFNSVVLGAYALQRASTGNDNVVIGYQSMFSHENGQYNVAVGSLSLSSNTIGDKNTAIGAMAGYRSKGNSNVFLGFQAGYFEQGNDKLYINNNASKTPLIYGDFKDKFVGINTSTPTNKLSIKADADGESGLQLQSLTSSSRTQEANGKTLSVDAIGNVILVKSGGSATGPVPELWSSRGNGIQNSNNGDVLITKNLKVGETISSSRFEVADGGIVFKKINALTTPLPANNKALSLDNFGNIILVDNKLTIPQGEWQAVGNDLTNRNEGKVVIKKDLEVSSTVAANDLNIKSGKIKFDNLSSKSTPLPANEKALSLDSSGNVILVDNKLTISESEWQNVGNDLTNRNEGKVVIKKDLEVSSTVAANDLNIKSGKIKFDNLSSKSTPLPANEKALSLDSSGNVILVDNKLTISEGEWQNVGNDLTNRNEGKVVIKKDLEVSSTVAANDLNIKSGKIKFDNLSSKSTPLPANEKALSLDSSGNVILVDNKLTISEGEWQNVGNDLTNRNEGKVVIKKDLEVSSTVAANDLNIKSGKIKFDNLSSKSTPLPANEKALSLDSSGNVILVDNKLTISEGEWQNVGNDLTNRNEGKVVIKKDLEVSSTVAANDLNIKSGKIKFDNLSSKSTPLPANEKALSLDSSGNVILVDNKLTIPESEWQNVGNDLTNRNEGKVVIKKDLEVSSTVAANDLNIKSGKIKFDNLSSKSTPLPANEKALSLDSSGNVILVDNKLTISEGEWQNVGNDLTNRNEGKVVIKKDLEVSSTVAANDLNIKSGKIKFDNLSSKSTPLPANEKALSLDSSGNVILVDNKLTIPESEWQNVGNDLTNRNEGKVVIKKDLEVSSTVAANDLNIKSGKIKFDNLSSKSTPLPANEKALSLDSSGNVILVDNKLTIPEGEWQNVGNDLTNRNEGKVVIKKDLEVSSTVAANDLNIKSGKIKFDNLSSKSTPLVSNGKVLTLDDNGNVILAHDGIGNTDPTHWKKTGSRIELKEKGQVVIGEGITQLPTNFNLFVSKGILAERVRVAVPNSEKWADYVFEPDYRLMPLHEVEKFILKERHLPNISSASDATIQGMDVLEMNIKLLEKVEELTLYAIEANKRIERLEKRLKSLEN